MNHNNTEFNDYEELLSLDEWLVKVHVLAVEVAWQSPAFPPLDTSPSLGVDDNGSLSSDLEGDFIFKFIRLFI